MLAGTDGRKIAQELKSQEETKSLPIIMISAHKEYEKDAHSYGVDTFVAKPFSSAHLLGAHWKILIRLFEISGSVRFEQTESQVIHLSSRQKYL
jgi:DNA-binding response OmpR family regulator